MFNVYSCTFLQVEWSIIPLRLIFVTRERSVDSVSKFFLLLSWFTTTSMSFCLSMLRPLLRFTSGLGPFTSERILICTWTVRWREKPVIGSLYFWMKVCFWTCPYNYHRNKNYRFWVLVGFTRSSRLIISLTLHGDMVPYMMNRHCFYFLYKYVCHWTYLESL